MNVRLLVLGILARQPMHGYELRRVVEENRFESWTGVLPGSIYHALRQLDREGLVALKKTEQTGARERDVYRITAAGRAALRELVREAWREQARPFPTALYGALSFRERLAPVEERAALEQRIADLDGEIARWKAVRPLKGPMTAIQAAMYDNGLEHLRIDRLLLERLRSLLDPGSG